MEIFLDMDGTIADLYHVPGWLEEILAENPIPYVTADPLPLVSELIRLRFNNLSVITWGSKGSTEEFLVKTEMAKIKWLEENFLKVNNIHCIPYGTPKFLFAEPGDILIDDEEANRKAWQDHIGPAYTPEEFTEILRGL